MNGFKERLNKGKKLEDYLKKYLDDNNIDYFNTGYEGLVSSKNARNKIRFSKTDTSFFVRHYPDVTMSSNKDSFLIEIKNSSGIEKDCFENYKALSEHLNLNVMLLLKDHKIYNIKDIVFSKANEFDRIAQMNIPITKNVWKEPRQMDKNNYYKYLNAYKSKGKYTSGCSFAFIDFYKSQGHNLDVLKLIDKKYS